jgi:hypothetical protein
MLDSGPLPRVIFGTLMGAAAGLWLFLMVILASRKNR